MLMVFHQFTLISCVAANVSVKSSEVFEKPSLCCDQWKRFQNLGGQGKCIVELVT